MYLLDKRIRQKYVDILYEICMEITKHKPDPRGGIPFNPTQKQNIFTRKKSRNCIAMKIAATVVLVALSCAGASAFMPQHPSSPISMTRLFMARKPFITGNWKLNPSTRQEAVELATGIANAITSDSPCDVALFVPYPFIEAAQQAVNGKLLVGAEVSFTHYSYMLPVRPVVHFHP